jgi:lipopolysaccharide transport system ATP-binding protein
MREIAIQAAGLSKRYTIGARQEGYRTFRGAITDTFGAPFRRIRSAFRPHTSADEAENIIWPVKDMSFEIPAGEVVGIIGRNGAGKTTLLKILARITEPTAGYVDIYGRVGSLLEVGTGFHPELTGRENVFLNGAILGMKRAEITRKFDEIVAFAEVEKFIDTPVKHYSSGMYLRLAFAVAAHLEPEILLVDEVLAVGDLSFQKKCTGKMGEVGRQGRTVLFVSHNMAAIRQLCRSAYLLSGGRIVAQGRTEDVINTYLASALQGSASDLACITDRKGEGNIRFKYLRIEDGNGVETGTLSCGQSARIVIGLSSAKAYPKIRVWISIVDTYDTRVMHLDSHLVGDPLPELEANGELVCEIPRVALAPGRYRVNLWLQSLAVIQDSITDCATLDVIDGNFFGTGRHMVDGRQVALMDYRWHALPPQNQNNSDHKYELASPVS